MRLLSVEEPDATRMAQAARILDESGAIDLDERARCWTDTSTVYIRVVALEVEAPLRLREAHAEIRRPAGERGGCRGDGGRGDGAGSPYRGGRRCGRPRVRGDHATASRERRTREGSDDTGSPRKG